MSDTPKLFGFSVFDKFEAKELKKTPHTFSPPTDNDGAAVVEDTGASNNFYSYGIGGMMASAINIAGPVKDEIMAIRKYRQMAMHHDCDSAIDDIVNEAIVSLDDNQSIVTLNTDALTADYSKKMIDAIHEEFETVLDLLDFDNMAYDIFRSWYVDSRLYYHKIPHKDHPEKGLQALRRIDPVLMKKVRQVTREPHPNDSKLKVITKVEEYFVFNEQGAEGTVSSVGSKIAPEAITFIHSGMTDPISRTIVGFLDKAYRPLNQVRMIEDALVIYRLARAPERRMFSVDTGDLPPARAEQYVRDLMNQYRNRLVYDAKTGEIQDNSHHMHMLEDFWFPTNRNGGGTKVDVLGGGQNLAQIEDIYYFQKIFYKALNVPISRMDPEQGTSLARASEITRDELKFAKFIRRLQRRFAYLFIDILKTQLLLKKVVTPEDWNNIYRKLKVDFAKDSYYEEVKNQEILDGRLNTLNSMRDYVGVYYSEKNVRNTILRQTDEEIERINMEIRQERAAKAWFNHDNAEQPQSDDQYNQPTFYGQVDYSNKDVSLPPPPPPEVDDEYGDDGDQPTEDGGVEDNPPQQ